MPPRSGPGYGYPDEYQGRPPADLDVESDGDPGESEDSDEEAAALARIRNRSNSRRGSTKRASGEGFQRVSTATAAKRQKGPEPIVDADLWVCCDRCNKWRVLRKDVFDRTVREDERWYCELNFGR
ncbi:hypothetical protein APUTEX25_005272 [Auxenochlorella protothecoides]|uniref:CW-type domain-containing protein n=2 Tax=Auxenochlorella protothecoides TaxID=3075 RepID=A0A3M7KRZ2_AUXPR|nr:hypothetical protein APUTEX25_005272 [Auxenochlorella protothecoides]|eukprot:RMZ53283.1 hypothetical protein APUTEX25_005272 [Auxenochlorella protothecoides]